jgi:hypothetical protein
MKLHAREALNISTWLDVRKVIRTFNCISRHGGRDGTEQECLTAFSSRSEDQLSHQRSYH